MQGLQAAAGHLPERQHGGRHGRRRVPRRCPLFSRNRAPKTKLRAQEDGETHRGLAGVLLWGPGARGGARDAGRFAPSRRDPEYRKETKLGYVFAV